MDLVISNTARHSLRDFASWQFLKTGDYQSDCATGRRLARDFLSLASDESFPIVLPQVIASIAAGDGSLSGLEIGFFTQLGRRLVAASSLPEARPPLTVCRGLAT